MKRLIIYILSVGLISGLCSFCFYFNLFKLETIKKTNFNKTFNYISKSKENNQILFVGSSRVWVHIDPEKISKRTGLKCYNLACDGSGLVEHRAMIARYLYSHPKPTHIFLNVDFLCFDVFHETYNFPEYFKLLNDTVFARYLKPFNPTYRSQIRQLFHSFKWMSALPDEDKLSTIFRNKFFEVDLNPNYKGYLPVNKKWGIEAEKKIKTIFTAKIPPEGLKVFHDIVAICKKNNIQLIALIAPFQKRYRKIVKNADWAMKKIENICSSNEIELWNISELPLSKSVEYFYNSTHLNSKGSSIYSDTLASRIQKMIQKK